MGAAIAWRHDEQWPPPLAEFLLGLAVVTVPAATNGAIGTLDALRHAKARVGPVIVIPLIFLIVFELLGLLAQHIIGLWLGATIGLVAWIVGRLGQRIGLVAAHRTPDAAASKSIDPSSPVA